LSENENIEFTVIHIITKEEGLFDYLYHKFQNEIAYQPGLSKRNHGGASGASIAQPKK
jgi:hypothetical protein